MADPEHDIAILRIDSSIPPLKLQGGRDEDVESKIGSYIGYSGYIHTKSGFTKITERGSVSGKLPIIYKTSPVYAYILGATANHGNSGSPVFSLQTGEVIGIINAGDEEIQGITFSTAISQDVIDNMTAHMPNSGY